MLIKDAKTCFAADKLLKRMKKNEQVTEKQFFILKNLYKEFIMFFINKLMQETQFMHFFAMSFVVYF